MVYLSFSKFRLAKKLEKQGKNRYFDITSNFEHYFNNFTEFLLDVLVVLNIFVGERSLELPPHIAAPDLNRQVEDVFAVLKFIFSTQRNSFSTINFFYFESTITCMQISKTIRSLKIVLELSATM